MADSPLPPLVLDGWYVLHQFFRLSPPATDDPSGPGDRGTRLAELFAGWQDLGDDGWSGLYRIVGGGTDLMVIHFRPTLEALSDAERALARGAAARDLVLVGDYLSTVELGLYAVTAALAEQAREDGVELRSEQWNDRVEEVLEQERTKGYVRRRLYPHQPEEMPYVCFYPMDKRRAPGQNWYTLPVEERARMMGDHGQTGRLYAGRISQIITGSVGLDDWEWAVTLFAGDPLDFKRLVTEMRYDEVSSVYADFGSFWVGRRIGGEEIREELRGLDSPPTGYPDTP